MVVAYSYINEWVFFLINYFIHIHWEWGNMTNKNLMKLSYRIFLELIKKVLMKLNQSILINIFLTYLHTSCVCQQMSNLTSWITQPVCLYPDRVVGWHRQQSAFTDLISKIKIYILKKYKSELQDWPTIKTMDSRNYSIDLDLFSILLRVWIKL